MENSPEPLNDRDHRVIGKQMKLFCTSELVGPGLILWSPRGSIVRIELQNYMQKLLLDWDYSPVFTPHIGRLALYTKSGHYPFYAKSQFPLMQVEEEGDQYLLKPMNCPHHCQIYSSEPRSYRDLPIRYAEFGTVYRNEQSGSLSGLTRVRGLTQDDAHIFCASDQVESELRRTLELVRTVFKTFGFDDYRVQVSLRDQSSSKYIGEPANWDYCEEMLQRICKECGFNYECLAGEAAFYGPKIDFMVKDCIGREWQLGTVQLDYNLPERFDLTYVGKDGLKHRPVMIHRAPFGSIERFFAILIEHFAGDFPFWLAPVHARVASISEKNEFSAKHVSKSLKLEGLRIEEDFSSDKIGAKVASSELAKVPFLLVVGKREAASDSVSVRGRNGKDYGMMSIDDFLFKAKELIELRSLKIEPWIV